MRQTPRGIFLHGRAHIRGDTLPLRSVLDAKLLTQTDSVNDKIEKVREYLFQSKEFEALLSKALER